MATSIESQLYPASTEDSNPIPMEIMRPLALRLINVTANLVTSFVLLESYRLLSISSNVDCALKFASAPAGALVFPLTFENVDTLYIPASTIMTIAPPIGLLNCSICPVNHAEAGKVFIQSIQKWAGLGLRRQATLR